METENIDQNNEALVTFLLALAMTICRLDEFPVEQRRSDVFIRALHGHFEAMLKVSDEEGSDIRKPAKMLLGNLDVALRKAGATLLMRELEDETDA